MLEDVVTYEQAMVLKELGFDEICTHYYFHDGRKPTLYLNPHCFEGKTNFKDNKSCNAPTLAQAQKWLRKKGYSVEPMLCSSKTYRCDIYRIIDFKHMTYNIINKSSYEEALSAGITECLKILEGL